MILKFDCVAKGAVFRICANLCRLIHVSTTLDLSH